MIVAGVVYLAAFVLQTGMLIAGRGKAHGYVPALAALALVVSGCVLAVGAL